MDDELLDRQTEHQNLYLRNLQEIKWRTEALDDIYLKKKSTRFFVTNVEFCVLQIRKILELIALSALVSDVDVYREKLDNIEKMWNARLILREIEKIHPNFYPQPVYIDPNNKYNIIDIKEDYLTKDLFVKIYEKCGKILHQASPFLNAKDIEFEYKQVWNNISEWRRLIIRLLNTHIVKLYNSDLFYFIMADKETGMPHGNILSGITEEEQNEQDEI